jgi:hypothetical protein
MSVYHSMLHTAAATLLVNHDWGDRAQCSSAHYMRLLENQTRTRTFILFVSVSSCRCASSLFCNAEGMVQAVESFLTSFE